MINVQAPSATEPALIQAPKAGVQGSALAIALSDAAGVLARELVRGLG